MLGNEAIARGAYEAGVKVTSAYPGTPSTEVSENVVKYKEIYAEWAPNEKVATEVAIGASMAGVRSMTMMKMVGLNVASDPLFTEGYIGVNGGMVLVVADDPGIYSSQNEQDTRMIARAEMVPVVEPSDSEEARYFTKRAYELSEKYDTPVILSTCKTFFVYSLNCCWNYNLFSLFSLLSKCFSLDNCYCVCYTLSCYLARYCSCALLS